MDVERSKKKLEKLCIRSHTLSLELEAAKIPSEEIEKVKKVKLKRNILVFLNVRLLLAK